MQYSLHLRFYDAALLYNIITHHSSPQALHLVLSAVSRRAALRQTKALSHAVEDVNAVIHTTEELLARTHGKDGHIGQRVDALIVLNGKCTVESDTNGLFGIDVEVLITLDLLSGGDTRARFADRPVLATVGVGHQTLEESVTRVPGGRKVAVGVGQVTGVGVLGETGALVDTDGLAALAVGVLSGEVVGIDRAHNVEAVTVVSGDENEGLLKAVGRVELGDGGLDSVVELEELTKSAVVVENVHHLVDGGSLGHEEPTLVARASLKDVNGLKSHLLETRLVKSGLLVTSRGERLVQVLAVDVAVEPLGHVGGGEDTKGFLVVVGRQQSSAVLDDLVILLGELLVVVLALVGDTTKRGRVELLSTTTEDNINGDVSPGVVLDTVQVGVDNSTVLSTVASVGDESSRSGIGNVRSRNNTDVAASEAVKHLSNGLNLGVVESILAGVGIDVQAVDCALVAGVKSSSRVGRISDETVN